MPKTILVDFRGGVNERISPHMVGDTQGQAGQDLDLSAVRLQGRRKLDETAKALGTFYYEVGTATGKWVSTDSQDETYYAHSTDFAVWNRDLYVAFGVGHPNGEIDVYRDAGDEPLKLSFNPPQAASATGGIVSNTTLEPEVTGQDAVDDSSTTVAVTNLNGGTLQWGLTSQTLHTYEPTNTVASGADAADSSRTWYVWQKKNSADSVISSDFYAQTTSTSGTSFQLHTRQYSVIGEDYALGSDWSQMGYTRTNWNERDDHPDSPNTAPGDSYYKFTKGSSSPVSNGLAVYYQQVTNQTFHTISSGGNWTTPAIVREDPNYSADTPLIVSVFGSYRVKWERDYESSQVTDPYYDSSNYWINAEQVSTSLADVVDDPYFDRVAYQGTVKKLDTNGMNSDLFDGDNAYWSDSGGVWTIGDVAEYPITINNSELNDIYATRPDFFHYEEGGSNNTCWLFNHTTDAFEVWIYGVKVYEGSYSQAYDIPTGYSVIATWNGALQQIKRGKAKVHQYADNGRDYYHNKGFHRFYSVDFPFQGSGFRYATFGASGISDSDGYNYQNPPLPSNYTAWYIHHFDNAEGVTQTRLRIYINGSTIYDKTEPMYSQGGRDLTEQLGIEINGKLYLKGSLLTEGGNGRDDNVGYWGHWEYGVQVPHSWQVRKLNYTYTSNEAQTTGQASWMWDSTNVKNEFNVTAPSAGPHTSDGYDYYLGTYEANYPQYPSTDDVKYYRIYRQQQPDDVYNPIVWSSALPEPTYSRDTTYTYSAHSDDKFLDGQAYVPDTPVFDRDWSRYKLYRIATASDTLGFTESMWETDAALGSSGAGWLLSGTLQRLFVNSEDGYYLRTVRVENGLPVHSQEKTLVSTTGLNPSSGVTYLPRRLNFSITNPTDHNASTWLCWQLLRTDSLDSNLVLGYIKESSISLTTPNSSNNMTLSGLSSSKTYRVKWGAYQDAALRVGAVTSDLEVGGVEIVGKTSETITLVPESADHWGFDLYVEERLLQPSTESSSGDIWATVRCFDGFKYTSTQGGTSVPATVTASDYLDMFDEGVSSSGGLTSFVQEYPPPTYLKFLRESNNFFFGVGTTGTPDTRYKNATVNKSDSYLFISQYNNPRNWPLDGFLEFEDSITGLASFPGEVLVWTANATYRVFGSAHNAMRKVRLATTEGCPPGNHRTIVQVNQYLLWLSAGGICVYDGASVQNITKSRFTNFSIGSNPHAGQFEGIYYCCGSTEVGYQVNTNLEGFPIVSCDLREGHTAFGSSDPEPVLVYRPRTNRLYSRRGMVAVKGVGDQTDRNTWSYTTRAFDGGAYGRTKLLHSLEINSENCSGKVQVLLDGMTSSNRKSAFSSPYSIDFSMGFPITIYLPANTIADTWSVELTEMTGQIDYIACEFEVL